MEICEHCNTGELKLVAADPPWTVEHFICPVCDSTYAVEYDLVFEPEFEV
jgi:hypothetical protein